MTHIAALCDTLPKKLPAITMPVVIPAFIAACSSQPTARLSLAPIASSFANIGQQLSEAERLSYPERASLTFEITKKLIKTDPSRAQQILDKMPYEPLPQHLQAEFATQQAQIAQINHQYGAIFEWLDRESVIVSNDTYINAQAHILKALTYSRFGEYQASLDEWLLAAPYLTEAEQEPHYNSFWQTLMHVPAERLNSLYRHEKSHKLKGWLALALIYQTDHSLNQQLTDLEQWKRDWTNHPAHKCLPGNLENLKKSSTEQPDKVAVLLPLSGSLSKAGEAVRDGILASHYEAINKDEVIPELRFYNTQNVNINDLASRAIGRRHAIDH